MGMLKRYLTSTIIVTAVLLILLPLLAMLQYKWLAQLSERERERMRENMWLAARRFSEEVDEEIFKTANILSFSIENKDAFNTAYEELASITPYPKIFRDIYEIHEKNGSIRRYDPVEKKFVKVSDPISFTKLPDGIHTTDDHTIVVIRPSFGKIRFKMLMARPGPTRPIIKSEDRLVFAIDVDELKKNVLPTIAAKSLGEYSARIVDLSKDGKVIYKYGSDIDSNVKPDVTLGLIGMRWPGPRPNFDGPPPPNVAEHRIGVEEKLSIRAPGKPPLFNRGMREDIAKGDSPLNDVEIVEKPISGEFKRGDRGGTIVSSIAPPTLTRKRRGGKERGGFDIRWENGRHNDKQLWQLQLNHSEGSLVAAVNKTLYRNLLMSFGILAILAGAVIQLLRTSKRAQQLAQRQMEFTAGISHELRTPLTVIKSAAWNLINGIVKEEKQVKQYSQMIGKESDRLIDMIEDILQYAGAQSDRVKSTFVTINIRELIDDVLARLQPLIDEGGFTIEKNIDINLPEIKGNPSGLSRALRNLLDNAMKYSGQSKTIKISATFIYNEVIIDVMDYGIGISKEDLKNIFDPFHRGKVALAEQIRGNGLGLNIANNIVKAHGGRITVESEPGGGSTFALHLRTNI